MRGSDFTAASVLAFTVIGRDDVSEHVELEKNNKSLSQLLFMFFYLSVRDFYWLCEQGPDDALVEWWGGQGSQIGDKVSFIWSWQQMLQMEVLRHGDWCWVSSGLADRVNESVVVFIVLSFLQEHSNNCQAIRLIQSFIE